MKSSPREIDLVFLDFETTGGNPFNSTLIEIGAIRYSNGVEVARFETLVNPKRPVPSVVKKITGIQDDMLADAPSIEDVFHLLVDFIGQAVVVAHGAQGDVAYLVHLSKELLQTEYKNFYFCTHLLVHHYLSHIPSKTLSGIAEYFALDFSQAHTAMSDAEMTAGVFWKLYAICEKNGLRSCEDLFKLQGDIETIKKLGPGINPSAVDNATHSAGVVYLLNSQYEISYLTATPNIRKELRKLVELGQNRDLNLMIADAANFKFFRTHHFLNALLHEKMELLKMPLKMDPRKVYHRSENFLQILIPEELQPYFHTFDKDLHSEFMDFDKKDQEDESFYENEHVIDVVQEEKNPIFVKKSRKSNSFLKTEKYQQNRIQDPSICFSIGHLKEGMGYCFGPFENVKAAGEQLATLLQMFPFDQVTLSVSERLLNLRILVSFFYNEVSMLLDELSEKNRAGLMRFFAFPKQTKQQKLIKKVLQMQGQIKITDRMPLVLRSGLAIISVNETKSFDVFLVIKGKVIRKIVLAFEQGEKLSNARFITRLFQDHYDEIKSNYDPLLFTDNSCADIELISHWLAHKKGEGEFIDFDQLENLYDPSLL